MTCSAFLGGGTLEKAGHFQPINIGIGKKGEANNIKGGLPRKKGGWHPAILVHLLQNIHIFIYTVQTHTAHGTITLYVAPSFPLYFYTLLLSLLYCT